MTNLKRIILCGMLLIPFAGQTFASAEKSSEELLKLADEYRNFKDKSFSFNVKLISYKPRVKTRETELEVEILGSRRSLIRFKTPVKDKGKAMLMNGNNLWFHTPRTRKPIRITQQQRLLGEASNGDVASTDFSGDYIPTLLGKETVLNEKCYKLELNAKNKSAPYQKLYLWTKVSDHSPFMAKFFAISGKHLKTAFFKKYQELKSIGDKKQLVEIEIIDPVIKGKRTVMKYSNFKVVTLSEAHFQPAYLRQIR